MGLDGAPHPPNLANGFARRPRIPWLGRERKAYAVIIIAITIWAIIIIPAMIPGTHTSSIERTAGSDGEIKAIKAVEAMDMANVLGIERLGRSKYGDFRWSNVTDGKTIEFYQDIIDEMDRSWDKKNAAFEYTAECQYVDRVLLFPHPEEIRPGWYYFGEYSMESSNAMADFEGQFRYMDYQDLTRLPHVGEGYFLEDVYIIRQHLGFDYWLSDEYHLIIEQLVILNGDLELMVLMSDPEWREIPICYG